MPAQLLTGLRPALTFLSESLKLFIPTQGPPPAVSLSAELPLTLEPAKSGQRPSHHDSSEGVTSFHDFDSRAGIIVFWTLFHRSRTGPCQGKFNLATVDSLAGRLMNLKPGHTQSSDIT